MSPNLLEKATFGRSWDPKVACMITLTLVFLCGAAAGAVIMNFGVHNRLHQPSFDTAAGRELYFSRMKRELNLSPAQQEQIRNGYLDGSLGQQPFLQGFYPVVQLYLQIDRGIAAANLDTSAQLVTKADVDTVGKRFEN